MRCRSKLGDGEGYWQPGLLTTLIQDMSSHTCDSTLRPDSLQLHHMQVWSACMADLKCQIVDRFGKSPYSINEAKERYVPNL